MRWTMGPTATEMEVRKKNVAGTQESCSCMPLGTTELKILYQQDKYRYITYTQHNTSSASVPNHCRVPTVQ